MKARRWLARWLTCAACQATHHYVFLRRPDLDFGRFLCRTCRTTNAFVWWDDNPSTPLVAASL